jgi:predicted PurR-regulated permease PerM
VGDATRPEGPSGAGAEARRPPASERQPGRGFLARVGLVLLVLTLALLVWYAVEVLLLVFAGVLLAVFLRGLSAGLSRRTGLGENWSLAVVCLALLLAVGGAVWWLAPEVAAQTDELRRSLPGSVSQAEAWLARYEWGRALLGQLPPAGELMPDNADLFSRVTGVFSTTLSVIANFVIILFVGLYLAADSATYTNGLVKLFPRDHRRRAREVVDAVGDTLWWWLVGKLIAMAVVGVLTWVGLSIMGVPLALTLGLLAALLDFIPNIGPVIAGVPAVLLALVSSPRLALYVFIFYVFIQVLESYVLTPVLQMKTVKLPPALTIVAQVLLGVLTGGIGLILATPLAAGALVVVKMLYVEDTLGDGPEEKERGAGKEGGEDEPVA